MNNYLNCKNIKDFAKNIRRELHKIPEQGLAEYKTQAFLLEKLKDMMPDEIIEIGTGIKAVFYADNPIGTLCFRADMDGLSIQEENDVDYASSHQGFMHACGHDGHMTMLLCFAKVVFENKSRLKHNIVLLFQPAEESVGGAKRLIDAGALANPKVDAVFGFHLMPHIDQGLIGVKEGALMASTCEFDIEITGKNSHAAMPHNGSDAIMAAATLITQLQTIVSRNIDPFDSAVVAIGVINGGDARNIVAKHVVLKGTTRSYSSEIFNKIKGKILAMLKGIETSMDVSAKFIEEVHYPAVINDDCLAKKVRRVIGENVIIPKELMTAEDFSFYQEEVRGVFMFLGCKNVEKGFVNDLHTPNFNFDEDVLVDGLMAFSKIAFCEDILC